VAAEPALPLAVQIAVLSCSAPVRPRSHIHSSVHAKELRFLSSRTQFLGDLGLRTKQRRRKKREGTKQPSGPPQKGNGASAKQGISELGFSATSLS
jgi:hypothetical protein